MSTSLIRRLGPYLAARFRQNQKVIITTATTSSSSSSYASFVIHHVASYSSSSASMNTVHMTESCIRRMKELEGSESSTDEKLLRLSVETGGCSGFQYVFNLDHTINSDDRVFEKDGIKLVVDNISYDFVKGATVDYVEELIRSAFVEMLIPMSVADLHVLKMSLNYRKYHSHHQVVFRNELAPNGLNIFDVFCDPIQAMPFDALRILCSQKI